jgi:hypothetical protein
LILNDTDTDTFGFRYDLPNGPSVYMTFLTKTDGEKMVLLVDFPRPFHLKTLRLPLGCYKRLLEIESVESLYDMTNNV